MRRDRPSLTASLVAAVRALYTELPPYVIAPDPFAAELLPAWLALPTRAAARMPAKAAHRLIGAAALGLTYNVALRTRAIDDALREGLAAGATQLVLLGAGLDSRAHRIDELRGKRVFEVDHPSTQRYKAERLARLGGRARATTRVAIDFERDRLGDVLRAAGFDPAAPSFWIWEGVTVYLTREAIVATLRAVGELAAPGSRVAVTYTRPGARRGHAALEPLWPLLGNLVGEPVRGMIETEALLALLAEAGFAKLSDESAAEWSARFWPGEAHAAEWERLVVAERVASPSA
jgi:methyltransferase (TIGR00027 family)